jgi:adenylosuccinate synthase
MNMQILERAVRINGVTHIVFSKVDVLRAVSAWAVYDHDQTIEFNNEKDMKDFVASRLETLGIPNDQIYFSESKETI